MVPSSSRPITLLITQQELVLSFLTISSKVYGCPLGSELSWGYMLSSEPISGQGEGYTE